MDNRYHVHIGTEPIDVETLYRFCLDPSAGAVDLFVGTVRDSFDGRGVSKIDYQAYPEMAEAELRRIVEDALTRWPLLRVAAVHRLGLLGLTEASVAIAVSAPHRAEAFDACRGIMESVKRDLPVWKKEFFADGSVEWKHAGRPDRS